MPQALRQLSEALRLSLSVYDVYDSDRIATAGDTLTQAAEVFTAAAQHLLNARTVISHQGVNQDNTGNLRRRPPSAGVTRPLFLSRI